YTFMTGASTTFGDEPEAKSIIVTTNLQFGQWNNVFGDPILTEAVIDRLIHHSHLIIFKGDSHRYKDSISLNQ
ncbi:ATP-binding protein, partial [Geobacillus stearothermophilus]|uniref:ATP-binding protein n=2 Tax=Geobacillus stearothermophilus TaxID=1422 RepID=UPI002E251060